MSNQEYHSIDRDQIILDAAARMGLLTEDVDHAKTYIQNYTRFTHTSLNWEMMGVTEAIGGDKPTDKHVYGAPAFDGRYIYYAPCDCGTFTRYDTTRRFSDSSGWENMPVSSVHALGSATTPDDEYLEAFFDGRYVYYNPMNAESFTRYDTTSSFTHSSAWSMVDQKGVMNNSWAGIAFDGNNIYFAPYNYPYFIKYNTASSFTDDASWSEYSRNLIANSQYYKGAVTAGGYVYFCPHYATYKNENCFVRYNTGSSFTENASWEKMSFSTAFASIPGFTLTGGWLYSGSSYDGRYVYYAPHGYAPNAHAYFARYDTTKTFTSSSSWEMMSVTTATSLTYTDFFTGDCLFDGMYIYYFPTRDFTNPTSYPGTKMFIRYNTTSSFTNSNSWNQISTSAVCVTSSALQQVGCFDGQYIYFSPRKADNFLRFRAVWSKINSYEKNYKV